MVLVESACEGEVSAGERCLSTKKEERKERIEDGLKERKGTRDGQRLASCGRNREKKGII